MLDWLREDPRTVPTVKVGKSERPVAIRRHARAQRMTLRLAPDGSEVRLTIPQWGRTADALEFARSRSDWLADQLEAIPSADPIGPGGLVPYRGGTLLIEHDEAAPRKPYDDGETVRLGGPVSSLQSRLRRWLENEARSLLGDDLGHYCERADRDVPKLALSGAQRRWGSCSSNGTVRINWRLVMAPDFVRRSVVAHEVTHLIHFDHSPAFHQMLAELFEGEIDEANHWLKHEGRSLYVPFG